VRRTKRGARQLEELGRDTDEVWLAADEALVLCVRDLVASSRELQIRHDASTLGDADLVARGHW
jgi:hypothetical protein